MIRSLSWLALGRVSDRSGQWEQPTWITVAAPYTGAGRVGLRLTTDPVGTAVTGDRLGPRRAWASARRETAARAIPAALARWPG